MLYLIDYITYGLQIGCKKLLFKGIYRKPIPEHRGLGVCTMPSGQSSSVATFLPPPTFAYLMYLHLGPTLHSFPLVLMPHFLLDLVRQSLALSFPD